jgi:hypothetical protein
MTLTRWLAALFVCSMVLAAACGPTLSDAGAPNGNAAAPDGGSASAAEPPHHRGGW